MIHIAFICKEEHDLNRIYAILSTQKDFDITCLGRSGYDAIKYINVSHPDIMIMDLLMGDITGTDLAPIIIQKSPATKLIAICSHNNTSWIETGLRAGITGFLFSQFDMDNLTNAARTVLYGGYYISKCTRNCACNYLTGMVSGFARDPMTGIHAAKNTGTSEMSNTEQRILTFIVKGYSDKEIAEELCIAPGTVRNCITAIKRKTMKKSRAQLAAYLIMLGMKDIS